MWVKTSAFLMSVEFGSRRILLINHCWKASSFFCGYLRQDVRPNSSRDGVDSNPVLRLDPLKSLPFPAFNVKWLFPVISAPIGRSCQGRYRKGCFLKRGYTRKGLPQGQTLPLPQSPGRQSHVDAWLLLGTGFVPLPANSLSLAMCLLSDGILLHPIWT